MMVMAMQQKLRNRKGQEPVPLIVGNYFTHNPSNVVDMQIMGFNSNGRFRISITCQCNLPSYS
jgi:hypothetical protein